MVEDRLERRERGVGGGVGGGLGGLGLQVAAWLVAQSVVPRASAVLDTRNTCGAT